MIRLNPTIPNSIFELIRHNTIGDYMRTYGDEITRRYEDMDLIYFPYFPLNFDVEFIRSLILPPEWKKIGTTNGIEKPIFTRQGETISVDEKHIFFQSFKNVKTAAYLQSQIASANAQIRAALNMIFPHYHTINIGNITWRTIETRDEYMHLDGYYGGKPIPSSRKGTTHRVKLFINIDSEPRKWWVSCVTPELLKRFRDQIPDVVADDIDMLNFLVTDSGLLKTVPYHEIDIPPMGAVIAESRVVPHAVRYGRKLVVAEGSCPTADMLDPSKNPDIALRGWLKQANIAIDPDPKPLVPTGKGGAYEQDPVVV